MANEKPGILRNLRVKRVALVDVGANFDSGTGDGAHIMLYKRHEVGKDGPGLGSVHVDTIAADPKAAARRKLEEDEANKNKKEKRMSAKAILAKMLGLLGEKDETKRAEGLALVTKSLDDLPDDDVAKAHVPGDDMCKCADCMAKAAKKRFDGNVEVAKAVDDMAKAHKVEIDTLQKSNKALLDAIEVEKNIRLDNEMTTLLKSFRATPFDMATDVAKFRKMKEVAPEAFERTIAVLKATDAQLAASGVYNDLGSSHSGSNLTAAAAWAQLEKKANELVTKSATPLTAEQAMDRVMFDPANKELLKQYRAAN